MKKYVIRKHGPQENINGHMAAPYTDSIVKLDIQPQTPDEYDGDPSGESIARRLLTWGADLLAPANEYTGVPADLLFYKGIWYECVSGGDWDFGLLAHSESKFVALPASKQPPAPNARTCGVMP